MWTKLTLIGCLMLTAIAVHTALRIEHLNMLSGTFLPRSYHASQQWSVPELKNVLSYIDTQIAKRRSQAFSVEHPNEQLPAEESFRGAPYSPSEQSWINRSIHDHAAHTLLHWWVVNFGSAQYFMAPLAFVWAVGNFLAIRKTPLRVTSGTCALLSFGAIFLMIFRGY
jgi:hypothetical protein